jgi:hypothetical protein
VSSEYMAHRYQRVISDDGNFLRFDRRKLHEGTPFDVAIFQYMEVAILTSRERSS